MPDLSEGLSDLAESISFRVGGWHEYGYANPPTPQAKRIPPLGQRSAAAIGAGHGAVELIDQLTRQLHDLRAQLVDELHQDSEIRGRRVDELLADRKNESGA